MKKILTYGTYDLITPGHIALLKAAKEMGDYLIVGVSTDEFNIIKHKRSYLSYEERCFIIESLKYVDEIIPEHDWNQKIDDIKNNNIDVIVMGGDWRDDERFESLKEYCEVAYIDRIEPWSSTNFRKHVNDYVENIESNI